jgi:hypothetical protein
MQKWTDYLIFELNMHCVKYGLCSATVCGMASLGRARCPGSDSLCLLSIEVYNAIGNGAAGCGAIGGGTVGVGATPRRSKICFCCLWQNVVQRCDAILSGVVGLRRRSAWRGRVRRHPAWRGRPRCNARRGRPV